MLTLVKEILYDNKLIENTLSIRALSSSGIISGYHIKTVQHELFLKLYHGHPDMADAEVKGLSLLKNTGGLAIPEMVCTGSLNEYCYLVTAFIISTYPNTRYWENMGYALAEMHKRTQLCYGLDFDNFIGTLPQQNTYCGTWIDFFMENRIQPQLQLLMQNADFTWLCEKFELLYKSLPDLLSIEPPALLHGDLWSGNVLSGMQEIPYFIDPAVYYGHREMELAFTTLFGGFHETFYAAYHENFPLFNGYVERFAIYNLYPLLVHHNLFGGHYLQKIKQTLKKFTT